MLDYSKVIHVEKDLNWTEDCIWVSNHTPLKPLKINGSCILAKPSGEKIELSKEALEEHYFAFAGGELYKPKYRPVRAITFLEPARILLPSGEERTMAEGAILHDDEIGYFVLDLADYEREYKVVGYRGAEKPTTPYSTAPHEKYL